MPNEAAYLIQTGLTLISENAEVVYAREAFIRNGEMCGFSGWVIVLTKIPHKANITPKASTCGWAAIVVTVG